MNKAIAFLLALFAALAVPRPAGAAESPAQLACLEGLLSEGQRAAIADLFPPRLEDDEVPADRRTPPPSASQDFARVIALCGDQHRWSDNQRAAAAQYLIELARLSAISARQDAAWGQAMERFARQGAAMLPQDGEPDDHRAAMIVAAASANGVGAAEAGTVIAYLVQYRHVEASGRAFAVLR